MHGSATPDHPALAWVAWALIAAYVVAALAMVFGPHTVGDVFTETDFYGSYGPGARLLQQGHLDPSRYGVVGPVFEVLLALTGFVIRDLFLAAELIAVASMGLALALWHTLVARRLGALAGLLTVAFLVTNAQFFRYGWSVTTDAPALALQAAALFALLGARAPAKGGSGSEDGPGTRRMRAAGLLAAFAFLTRYNSVALLPAGLAAIFFGWNGVPVGERARNAFHFVVGFLLPVAPWIAWSATHGGSMQFKLHHNIAFEVFARPQGIVWDLYGRDLEPQFPTPWSVLARDPVAVVSRMAFNVVDHARLDVQKLTGVPLAVAAALGLLLSWRDRSLARAWPVLATGGLLFLTLVPAFHSERYSLAVLPMWALLAALAFASPRLALVTGGWWWKLLLVPVVAWLALEQSRAFTARVLSQLPIEVLETAERVRPLVRPGDKVMARKPHFAWHAGLTPVALPLADTLSEWADAARATGTRWLYFSWPEAELRPRFEWLLDSSSVTPGLTVRAATVHWPAVVYEIGPDFGEDPAWLGNDTLVAVHRARSRVLINGQDREARVFLAMHEFERGNPDAAQGYLDELLALNPEDADVLLLAAENRLKAQDPDGAIAYFDRFELLAPGTADARVGRGWAAALKGDEATAAQLWAPLVATTSDANTLRRMGIAFARTGDQARLAEVRARLQELGVIP